MGEVAARTDPASEPKRLDGIWHIISERAVSFEEPLWFERVGVGEYGLVMQHSPER